MKLWKKVYSYSSSMKTGLMLLALIALISALGSLVVPEVFFQTLLFRLLLFFLIVNMVLCTLRRVIVFNWRLLKTRRLKFVREFGILLLHAGMILIIVGAGVFLVFGQSVMISLSQGESLDVSKEMKVNKPFSIYLDDFHIEYNNDGSASQYYSQVKVTVEKEIKESAGISVNYPLDYQNIKAYQQSYGYKVRIKVTGPENKGTESLLDEEESLTIPGTDKMVKMYKYIPNYDPEYAMYSKTLRPDNPRIIFSVYEKGELLGVGVAKIGEHIKLDDKFSFVFSTVEPYTVLKLKSDPGLPVTSSGAILFMLGVSMALLAGVRVQKQKYAEGINMKNEGMSESK